jgi:signal transduction histidine kinase
LNFAVPAQLVSAAIAFYAAFLGRRLAPARGWTDQRWFSLAAAGAGVVCLCGLVINLGGSPARIIALQAVRVALDVVLIRGWIEYANAFLARPVGDAERWALRGLLLLGLLALAPGLLFTGTIRTHVVPALGATYFWAEPTLLGSAFYALFLLSGAAVAFRFLRAWRDGKAGSGTHALAGGAVVLLGLNDLLGRVGVLATPLLVDVGFVLPVVAVAASKATRLRQDAEDLSLLRTRLEALVEERTRALTRSQEALLRAQRLASLGQFAAGVAHEVNNPAAVVAANLHFVVESLGSEPAQQPLREAVEEAIEAMGRITALVRRLVDAGRLATSPVEDAVTSVDAAVAGAVEEVQIRFGARIRWSRQVAEGLRAAIPGEVLHDVLLALLVNAGEAVPEVQIGHVDVIATMTEDGTASVSVLDDGRGLAPEARTRLFEPFFTTKPAGRGSGLGLSVARALVESHGGTLDLAPRPGGGVEARLELRLATG